MGLNNLENDGGFLCECVAIVKHKLTCAQFKMDCGLACVCRSYMNNVFSIIIIHWVIDYTQRPLYGSVIC